MPKHRFSAAERYAVYTVHGEQCYLCGNPIDMTSMEVDHVIPESLVDSPELPEVLRQLGCPNDFNINGFANWLPSCQKCNSDKSMIVFKPTPIVQIQLQKLAAKETEVRAAAEEVISNRRIARALNTLERAKPLSPEHLAAIQPLIDFHIASPHRVEPNAPVRLSPVFEVLSDDGSIRTIRGPFGIGSGPSHPSDAMRCPSCGSTAFNGARCVICGVMDDD